MITIIKKYRFTLKSGEVLLLQGYEEEFWLFFHTFLREKGANIKLMKILEKTIFHQIFDGFYLKTKIKAHLFSLL